MVCRASRLSSAYTTFARGTTGLDDNQILSLNHALMREGAEAPAPTQAEWNAFIDNSIRQYNEGGLVGTPGTRNLLGRLEQARSEVPSGPRFYAAQRLVQRAQATQTAHQQYITSYASRVGITQEQAAEAFRRHFTAASDDAHLRPGTAFASSFRATDDRSNLLRDRRSTYAYEQMENTATEQFNRHAEPSVQRHPVDSSAIAEMGYDPETGRVEVVMRSNPDRVYAYRMSPADYNDFASSSSVGSYYARHVRGNSDYQFSSAEEAHNSATRQRCPSCGEWMARTGHSCPPAGSEEARARDTRAAVSRHRGETPSQSAAVLRGTRNHVHLVDSDLGQGAIRIAGRARIQQEARHAGQVQVPVMATFRDANGELSSVTGNVAVEYNGRGQGYNVEAVTEPGDGGDRNLRCSCAEYRSRYTCPHVREAAARAAAHIRGEEVNRGAMRAAVENVENDLQAEYLAAAAEVEAAREGWTPSGTDMENNPAEFQALYDEAREARARYKEAIENGEAAEYPVPYLEENAFGGLATRESGRGMGVEIEFSFPDTMTYAEQRAAAARIGRQLRAERLTGTSVQQGYGATHGWYRDYHEEGWSYETDPTVNGGEIVSPVMYDEPATWHNLKRVCEILKENGADASGTAGMHVHVGVGDYDHDVANHTRLLALNQENEDLVYRMSMNQDRMSHRGTGYCSPNREVTGPYRNVSEATRGNVGHHIGLNLQSVSGRESDHVEFRTFDASLNPAVMQSQIGMAVYMAAAGSRDGSIDIASSERHPLGERVAANPHRRALTGDEWNESTRTVRRFIDRYVPGNPGTQGKDNPRVRQLVSMFAMTKWVRGRNSGW